jgi:hypothetical protein
LKTSTVKDPESLSLPSDSTRATEIFDLTCIPRKRRSNSFFFSVKLAFATMQKKKGVKLNPF